MKSDDHYDDNSTRKKEKVPSAGSTFFTGAVLFISFAVVAVLGYQFYMYDQSIRNFEICRENVKEIGFILESYACDNCGHYPEKLDDLVPRYVSAIPTCPAVKKDTYSESYCREFNPDIFSFCCKGPNHCFYPLGSIRIFPFIKPAGVKPDMPLYNSILGLVEKK